MSLSTVLDTATSGLMAAQTGLRTVSDNIANVNTPGYVRKQVDQQQLDVAGVGMGVQVIGIQRVTDQYLQLASLTAGSQASQWDAYSQYLDNAQSLFGDPSSSSFFFNKLDDVYSAFAASANDPSNNLLRTQALANVQDFLSEADRINSQLGQLGSTVDTRVNADVDQANGLLQQISKLNGDISRANLVQADASGAENIQSQLLDQLSSLMSIKVAQRDGGGVDVRSPEGVLLAGDTAATLAYNASDSTPGYITATQPGVGSNPQPIQISSGEVRGLLDLRDSKLPGISDELGEFVSRATDALNAAHNASSATPPPATLTGRDTGLDLPTAVSGFTGQTTVAIVNSAGVVQRTVAIDFDAQTMSVNGGAATATSPASFLADLNTALGGAGSATYVNNQLSIGASGGNGVAVDEDTSMKAGRAFSQFFGLNDLVRSSGFTNYETGLSATDPHGFTAGGTVTFRLAQPDGKPIRDVTVTMPAAPQMSDLIAALNNTTTGVGLYGAFSLDPNGLLSFTASPPTNASLSVVDDNTQRGAGGPSFSQLFGVGVVQRSARASQFQVDPALLANPQLLALGKLDLTVAAGTPALRPGDGSGAVALSQAGDATATFQAAGSLGQVSTTISRYASEFGGAVGRDAAAAETQKQAAAAVQTEAVNRRQSVESVNLDEELVHLQTYQQAFSASARMIQATKDLFDVLMNMV
ncbi:MAG TPA: flagellar hook-associated protein FlgK [Phenylobacterium sp.]|uniref:flagellar hook-associated protein FlgK n=1 Tax=Phenylobacterium sp. TaxID=1871053 RepID=UPI002C40603D|nr:flagellar hook-associated protein FlgK [Phenylobacterium sp.]HSV03912.1 flagellar hook-associated protein FlgK [Phenylobacterium sp.]